MSGPSNRFLFQGALYEPEPEIYDIRNRFYHPNLGRFMQSDPLGFGAGDMNLFRYCGNDPVNGSDPFGLQDPDMNGQGGEITLAPIDVHTTELPPPDPFAHESLELFRRSDPLGDFNTPVFRDDQGLLDSNLAVPPPPSSVDASEVRMIDQEDSFSPSQWSNQSYNLQWSLTHNGNVVSAGTVNGITPRQAYARTHHVGYATASGLIPGQTITYNFVTNSPSGFQYNGWTVTATVIDPWGIQAGSLQNRLDLQARGSIPAGINLRVGGGLSAFLYGQLPQSIESDGYFYAVPGGR
jgi:RHS repeat-associated protein